MFQRVLLTVFYPIAWYSVFLTQALEVIRQIKDAGVMPIDRAQMRIKLTLPQKDAKQVLEKLRSNFTSVESEEWQGDLEIVSIVYTVCLPRVILKS